MTPSPPLDTGTALRRIAAEIRAARIAWVGTPLGRQAVLAWIMQMADVLYPGESFRN